MPDKNIVENASTETDQDNAAVDGTIQVDSINPSKELDALVNDMPDVVPDAVEAAKAKEEGRVTENLSVVDKKGRKFDPNIHAVDKDGKAVLTSTGRFKKLTMPKAAPGGFVGTPGVPAIAAEAAQIAEIKANSVMFADLFINFGISIFGDEWKPTVEKGYDERAYLIAVNEAYMLENGLVKVPGWASMLLAYGLYTVKRLGQPRTRSFFQGLVVKVRAFVVNAWLWFQGRRQTTAKVKNNAEGKE